MERNTDVVTVFVNLFKEIPEDKIMWRLSTGKTLTAGQMVEEFSNYTDLGREYMSDVLRVSRDLLARQANK